jgi:class 3 adenylate cyclase
MPELLTGTVTFLFTDVERSTERLVRAPEAYARSLDEHRRILRAIVAERGGREVDCRGEEFFFAFARANDAVAAAIAAQSLFAGLASPTSEGLAVRMGIHTGQPTVRDDGYLGLDVHRAARICSLARGGQVLISRTTRELLVAARESSVSMRDLGSLPLKGFPEPEEVFQVEAAGLRSRFPAPRSGQRTAESSSAGRERELAAAALRALGVHRSLGHVRRAFKPRVEQRGLADLGWEVRARLTAAPEPLRGQLAELGGELFAASRSVVAVDRYLSDVDRKRLTRLLAEDTELGLLSKRAAAAAEATAGRLRLVNALSEARQSSEQGLDEIGSAIQQICAQVEAGAHGEAAALVAKARRSVRALASDLDGALAAARAAVKAEGQLRRTRHRGIFRRGEHYVVPYFDEVGLEHEKEFKTIAMARAFRDARREDEKRKVDFPGGPAPHDSAYHKSVSSNPPT